MTNGKIYISGPMTGHKDLNFPAFNSAAKYFRENNWEVVNPVDLNPDPNADWFDCICDDIHAMRDCTAIYLLDGWFLSPGANIERWVAIKQNMRILYQTYYDERTHY